MVCYFLYFLPGATFSPYCSSISWCRNKPVLQNLTGHVRNCHLGLSMLSEARFKTCWKNQPETLQHSYRWFNDGGEKSQMCLHTSRPSSPKPTDRLNHTNKDKLWICMLVSARPCGYRSLFQSALHQVRSERYPLSSRAKESLALPNNISTETPCFLMILLD